ncbi:MAG: peptidase M14 [Candidatus Latescibacteria bacterium]|nr:peptidase M14 [Candidatus Latescibacterota bacterium]
MPIQLDSVFPGGNIIVDDISGDRVRLHQDLRDTQYDWFYWCFRARGAGGRTVHFEFTTSRALGARGPAASLDGGLTWQWLGSEAVDGNAFSYSFPEDASEVRLSFAMPYQESNWLRFLDTLDCTTASRHKLCSTTKARDVDYMLLGRPESEPQHRAAITCRHHCCEMMVNYTLEGLIRWVASGYEDESKWLRNRVQFLLVPFVDKDGVEDGDQGKGRRPRDHGRDYEGESLYATTGAIRDLVPSWGNDRLHVGLDLHCPHISGGTNEVIYQVGSRHEHMSQQQVRFSQILESVASGPLPFLAADFMPFGTSWNTAENYRDGRSFAGWVAELPGVALGTSIELPYATARGAEVKQASARGFGKDLGMALATYLQALP